MGGEWGTRLGAGEQGLDWGQGEWPADIKVLFEHNQGERKTRLGAGEQGARLGSRGSGGQIRGQGSVA